ncbi:endocuticle structural glycoprotein SgAbd-2 [Halyomorpha halys]|uniref:endocuticle structural glycoprotein SgAbd-2 n=1 Tax=Halyomorpha halys TaxID=286706 RepID=UPI0006D4CA4F|nr:endocuticle structural glycoprotein SgAbd-2 [Halyomorpha halys]
MKTAIVLLGLVAACLAAEVRRGKQAPEARYYNQPAPAPVPVAEVPRPVAIVRQSADVNFDGTFNYDFEAENGISSYASGSMKPLSPEVSAQTIQGAYAYTAPDGTPISASYYADETGFHIIGDHIPTPHPIPEAIARSLEILPQLPQEEVEVPQQRKAPRPVVKRRV